MGQQAYNSKGEQQVGQQAESCCSTLAVTPMRHKGLLGWRYDCKCNYMITLVAEPRVQVFGKLREWGVERSEEGRAVYEVWQAVESKFPGTRATYNAIMPDHFHGIVYISQEGAADLGSIVEFFAGEAERRIGRRVWNPVWRDSVCIAKGQLHRMINYVMANPKRRWIKENNKDLFKRVLEFRHWRLDRARVALSGMPGADEWDFRSFSGDGGGSCPALAADAEIWDAATGEEITKPRKGNRLLRVFEQGETARGGQQGETASVRQQGETARGDSKGRQQAYNSKRETASGRQQGGVTWAAVGNLFLLDAPLLISVRISTKTPAEVLDSLIDKLAAKAARGAVLASAWISPGEKAVKEEALARGGRLIQLLPEGIGRFYKPYGRDFNSCAEGCLLQISPFEPSKAGAGRMHFGKARFEWLNLAARAICDVAAGFSREDLLRMGDSKGTASVRQQGETARGGGIK